MKYNFNGGSCTIRFIPVEGGSAVNLRFSLAQLAGGRYEKYARDLTDEVIALLGVTPVCADIDINAFLSPQNRVVAGSHTANSVSRLCSKSYGNERKEHYCRENESNNLFHCFISFHIFCPYSGKISL